MDIAFIYLDTHLHIFTWPFFKNPNSQDSISFKYNGGIEKVRSSPLPLGHILASVSSEYFFASRKGQVVSQKKQVFVV